MDKYFRLLELLRKAGKVAISLSGGKDSGLVAKAAIDAGIKAVAITISSPLFSRRELKSAESIAKEIGMKHIVVKSKYMPENDINRCYRCKKNMARLIKEAAEKEGFKIIADGVTVDDMNDIFRPGVRAASEEGIWHPLADAGFTARDVANAARAAGLSAWNKPSNSCLASRISYGEEITVKKLHMVENAEEFLGGISKRVRVRMHGKIARIEVLPEDFEKVIDRKDEITKKFRELGFAYTTLDLSGYRSGSMNDTAWQFSEGGG